MNVALFEQSGMSAALVVQLAADVESVEKELVEWVKSPVDVVQKVGQHTLEAGGKRLRPAFLLLSARATGRGFSLERAQLLGCCMELIHMATLIHDDIVDETDFRRGRPTAAKVYGNTASVLSGDVLLARAMTILAQDGDIDVIRASSQMVVEMAEGQAEELTQRGNFELDRNTHLEVIRKKTAAFVECCCLVGGLVAGAEPSAVDALSRYGANLGMAFQLIDDLLDYRGDMKKTGKKPATDFVEGCATLPLILARDHDKETRAFLEANFGKPLDDHQVKAVVEAVELTGAFKEVDILAQSYLERAFDALNDLPAGPPRDLLEAAGKFVVQRVH